MTMREMGLDGHKYLGIDKRTLSKVDNPPNVKDLVYSRVLPVNCDTCPYRSKETRGNGICTKYEAGSLCIIRKDIRKLVDEYSTRSPGQIIPLIREEFEANYEKLKFFEGLEHMSGKLDPEVTKRITVLTNLGKAINELEKTKTIVEVSETKTLSAEKKDEIQRIFKITKEESATT